jgi:atypical dual specificity phosphatase
MAGKSRSATMVIAYLMRKQTINYQEALEYVQARRNIVSPNEGFLSQLMKYQLRL